MEGEAKGFWRAIANVGEEGYKLGKDDPRRVAHAVKVGVALGSLSLIHYYNVFFHASGADGLLTITPVLAVFEYPVGVTPEKGLNRVSYCNSFDFEIFATYVIFVLRMVNNIRKMTENGMKMSCIRMT